MASDLTPNKPKLRAPTYGTGTCLRMKTSLLGVETTGPGVSSIYRSQSRSCSSKYPSQSTSPYLFFPDKPGISYRRISSSPTGLLRSCPFPCTSPLAGTRSTSCAVTGSYPKRSRPHFPARFSRPSLCTSPLACTRSMSCTVTGLYPKRLRLPFPARLSRPSLPRNCTMVPSIMPRGSRLSLVPRLNVLCLASPLSYRFARL